MRHPAVHPSSRARAIASFAATVRRWAGTLLLSAAASHAFAEVTVIDYYRMGETENASPGVSFSTLDAVGGKTLSFSGGPFYSGDVGAAAQANVGSTRSMNFFSGGPMGSATLLTTATDNFGLELWVKPTATGGARMLAYNGNVNSNGWGLYLLDGNYCVLYGGVGFFGSAPVTLNAWTHVAMVRDSGTMTLYVNGVASGTTTATPNGPSGLFQVAGVAGENRDFLPGFLDEVRAFTFLGFGFNANDLLLNHIGVGNTNDGGAGSLRQAMTNASSGQTININTNGTLTLASALPIIDRSMTINGPGAALFTVDGANAHRPFFVDGFVKVRIHGLTIANGSARGGPAGWARYGGGGGLGAGGAVFINRGTVTLSGLAYVGNSAVGGNGGSTAGSLESTSAGGGGLGGYGGNGNAFGGGGGGGGFLGAGGAATNGGPIGSGGTGSGSAGGGGGVYGNGGAGVNAGGGGGAFAAGLSGGVVAGGAGADGLGGKGGDFGGGGQHGAVGLPLGGGGGGGRGSAPANGGNGGRFGGGGGGTYEHTTDQGGSGGSGGDFGGGGGTHGGTTIPAGSGGFGGGGGGGIYGPSGPGGFGAGSGAARTNRASAAGPFGGRGAEDASTLGAGGGGGAALGGAIFVRSVTSNDVEVYLVDSDLDGAVTAGSGGCSPCGQAGSARGSAMFLHGGTTTLRVNAGTRTIAGSIGGTSTKTATLVKDGPGTLVLAGGVTELGTINIANGTLRADSNVQATQLNVTGAGTLAGNGTVGAFAVGNDGTLSPGNGVGSLSSGNPAWTFGGNYNWQLRDSAGAPGVGYDTLQVNGTLNLTSAFGFKVNLWTLASTAPDINGSAANFDPLVQASWTLVQTSGGISGFSASNFTVVTAPANGTGGFANPFVGTFSLAVSGNNLVLNYVVPVEIAVEQPAGSDIVDGGSRDFGSILQGAAADRVFTIRNTGTANLTGLGITIDGVDAAAFSVIASPAAPVIGGGNTTFSVRFAPTSIGAKNAALHIANNDANEHPFDIVLTGTATEPAEIVVEQPAGADLADGGSRGFGPVPIGASSTMSFTIGNVGGAALSLAGAPRVVVVGANAADFSVTLQPASSIAAATALGLANSGFEAPLLGAGQSVYRPVGPDWGYVELTGVARNGSPWFVAAAPEGAQAAFLQSNNSPLPSMIVRMVDFPAAGDYLIRFALVRRGGAHAANDVDVIVDNATLGTVPNASQPDDVWRTFSFRYQCPEAGTRPLAFFGTRSTGGDFASALDNVRILRPSTTEFQVTFTPSAAGPRDAQLIIQNSDADEGPFNIDLGGVGEPTNADIQVSKTNFEQGLLSGRDTSYTIQVLNAGPSTVSGVHVVDALPNGLSNGQWLCTSTPPSLCPNASGTGSIDQTTGTALPNGAMLQYVLVATASGAVDAFISNTVTATIVDPLVIDATPGNNSATDTDPIVPVGIFTSGFESTGSALLRAPLE